MFVQEIEHKIKANVKKKQELTSGPTITAGMFVSSRFIETHTRTQLWNRRHLDECGASLR